MDGIEGIFEIFEFFGIVYDGLYLILELIFGPVSFLAGSASVPVVERKERQHQGTRGERSPLSQSEREAYHAQDAIRKDNS